MIFIGDRNHIIMAIDNFNGAYEGGYNKENKRK